jgi:2-polyprenyl-3-methyl-5-hydroxy-6-metoxy-1,4-benzoquinol methylase
VASPVSQQEALAYFRNHAAEWASDAVEESTSRVNVVKQRNDYVLHVIHQRQATQTVLDVGSGTGDLVIALAKEGIRGIGVDFADEMIQIASERASQENLDISQFYCASIFDFDLSQPTYDCISANGFIEYISIEQLNRFIAMTYQALNQDGSLVICSRNRLFNLFSLNEFTNQEIEANTTSALLREAIAIVKAESLGDLLEVEIPPLPMEDQQQVNTGIDVSVRLQYTPLQIMKLLRDAGFDVLDITPIHIHGVVPRFSALYPEVHVDISTLLQAHSMNRKELITQASSFMIHAQKVG